MSNPLSTIASLIPVVASFFGPPGWAFALICMGSGVLSMAFAEKPAASLDNNGFLANDSTTDFYLPLIYGKCRVGINRVYAGTTGDDNKYLHIIGVIGEGPVNGIAQEDGVDQIFLNDKLYTEFEDLVYYEFFSGTSTQSACTGEAGVPITAEWTDPLKNTAYIYIRLQFDSDYFQSLPDITLVVEGLKVYDPVANTTAYSNNPALCAYDMLTRPSTRGGFGIDTYGGPVPASPRIDTTAVGTARDYCAAKGWTCNMPITDNQAIADNLALILSNFRGELVYSENKFKLRYRDLNYESVSMTLDEDDVIDTGQGSSLTIAPQTDALDRPNAIKAAFLNEEKKYTADQYIKTDTDAVSTEGDYREKEVKIYGLSSLADVMAMTNYFLERSRWGNVITLNARSRALSLEPMDLIELTHTMPGWTSKKARVLKVGVNPDLTASLTLLEELASLYDDTYNVTSHSYHTTTLPDPTEAPVNVINVSHSEEVYYYRGRSFTRWKIDFDPPAASTYPWWSHAEIYVKIGSGEWRYMTKSGGDYVIDPVEEGETYQVRLRSVSIHDRKEAMEDAFIASKTIVGKTADPTNLSSLTAAADGGTVSLFADPISDPDVEGYEVRLGDAWDGAIFISFNKSSSIRLTGVRPGTHKFWMSPRDNAGNYSENPISSEVTVFIPPGYTPEPFPIPRSKPRRPGRFPIPSLNAVIPATS